MLDRNSSLQMAAAGLSLLVGSTMLVPAPRVAEPQPRDAAVAWSTQLDHSLGSVLANCVLNEAAGHAAPTTLDAMLVQVRRDQQTLQRFSLALERAVARCLQHSSAW